MGSIKEIKCSNNNNNNNSVVEKQKINRNTFQKEKENSDQL